jgi:hypothetical protein
MNRIAQMLEQMRNPKTGQEARANSAELLEAVRDQREVVEVSLTNNEIRSRQEVGLRAVKCPVCDGALISNGLHNLAGLRNGTYFNYVCIACGREISIESNRHGGECVLP